jgi:L-lactate permease
VVSGTFAALLGAMVLLELISVDDAASLAFMIRHLNQKQQRTSWFAAVFVGTFPALLGAMVLSELISAGGAASPAFIIGYYLSSWMGRGYLAAAGFLGAIGSFISGSVMAGNMTFGAIQKVRPNSHLAHTFDA